MRIIGRYRLSADNRCTSSGWCRKPHSNDWSDRQSFSQSVAAVWSSKWLSLTLCVSVCARVWSVVDSTLYWRWTWTKLCWGWESSTSAGLRRTAWYAAASPSPAAGTWWSSSLSVTAGQQWRPSRGREGDPLPWGESIVSPRQNFSRFLGSSMPRMRLRPELCPEPELATLPQTL